ncbi:MULTISPECIES: arginine repressor [unclassified Clostridium]|uniref:Arginine repressor n=1 Tax=Clostridium sulfidigenes TaxID=318464 RepID=A0A927W970_9CLOT|nr:arginine repressor [Clostridium sulfidigenes]HAR84649.1 arginine repressor [Clostridium sp.]HBA02927.1 arginine repressor [Clostridium sp.]HCO74330.1 arginine repressor [Clostridium sp.]
MKENRHSIILDIIKNEDIETQEDLADRLRAKNINVTQATVSRDIKELNLIKTLSHTGRYKYAQVNSNNNSTISALAYIFSNTAISVEKVDKILVVRTITASAQVAAEAIDSFKLEGIAGTIAGDNTIFILVRTDEKAEELKLEIEKLIK